MTRTALIVLWWNIAAAAAFSVRPTVPPGVAEPHNPARKHRQSDIARLLWRSVCSFGLSWCLLITPVSAGYWDMLKESPERAAEANVMLMDHAVAAINTMYYDNTGGIRFQPRDFYSSWMTWRDSQTFETLQSREQTVRNLKQLVQSIGDPYSNYLTRQELEQELHESNEGFLGLGAIVEAPPELPVSALLGKIPMYLHERQIPPGWVQTLPVITAVAPNSPAERAGLTVGDRILAINNDRFQKVGVKAHLEHYQAAENYLGHLVLTIAKPVVTAPDDAIVPAVNSVNADWIHSYRQFRVKLPTTAATGEPKSIVSYQLLDDSIFSTSQPVGYIRLTRFSKAATEGYLQAVNFLEKAGAKSYIIDLRNNYGGVIQGTYVFCQEDYLVLPAIQEAMLTASTLLRDPHAVLCYTLNSRGGFTPHDVEGFVVDSRYPGYLLSREPKDTTRDIVRFEHPEYLEGDWSPVSSFASLHEFRQTTRIHRSNVRNLELLQQLSAQKNLVVLINEGTASSAEVFASALHDNGRLTALVGTKSYGKGLVQHTFKLPDGGGLRMTVAEYLTPCLQHVTRVGESRLDEFGNSKSGIQPDIYCDSRFGIPRNVGADICVGMALGALEDSELSPLAALQRSGDLGIAKAD